MKITVTFPHHEKDKTKSVPLQKNCHKKLFDTPETFYDRQYIEIICHKIKEKRKIKLHKFSMQLVGETNKEIQKQNYD